MSLTSHLRSPDSPVRAFLEDAFTIIEQSKQGRPFCKELSALLGLDTLAPCCLPTLAPQANQGIIGIAVDYRLRYYFAPYDAYHTAAGQGVMMLSGSFGKLGREFLDHQNRLISQIRLVGRKIPDADEETLNANCVILALFEKVYRDNDVFPPLADLPRKAKLNDLLRLARSDAVQDITQLSRAFWADAGNLYDSSGKATLNPTFKGSPDIGGADADLIVGSTLIEFKCLARVRAADLRSAAMQLLGYVLLDYDDRFGIEEIMVYLPRQRHTWRTPLSTFVLSPSDLILHLSGRGSGNIDAVVKDRLRQHRRAFRDVASSSL